MKITLLRSECANTRTCPNINATDQGTLVVQGRAVSGNAHADLPLGSGEAVVEVPLALLAELAVDPRPRSGVQLTGHGTVLIRGELVTDREVLGELALPDGELAVEVPNAQLPVLIAK
jgi:hypothetical protein